LPTFRDLSGFKAGFLVAVRPVGRDNQGGYIWLARCHGGGPTCKRRVEVRGAALTSGNSKSCGCRSWASQRDRVIAANTTHRLCRTRTQRSYESMLRRCTCKTAHNFRLYGGAGVKVCTRWLGKKGLTHFVSDLGLRKRGTTLGRLKDTGMYSVSRCSWQTKRQQAAERVEKNKARARCRVKRTEN
jgi:hypothetical protein